MQTNHSAALTQCVIRSARVKRGSRAGASVTTAAVRSGLFIVAPVRVAHPRVDVVAAGLPVARDAIWRSLDFVEPLGRLVAVHRRDVEADRTAVVAADRLAVE